MNTIIPEDFRNYLIDYFDNTHFTYGLNPVEIMVIPCDLINLILNIKEITDKIKKFKVKSIFKKPDRILFLIDGYVLHYMVIRFENIANNIYEVRFNVINGIAHNYF